MTKATLSRPPNPRPCVRRGRSLSGIDAADRKLRLHGEVPPLGRDYGPGGGQLSREDPAGGLNAGKRFLEEAASGDANNDSWAYHKRPWNPRYRAIAGRRSKPKEIYGGRSRPTRK